MSDDKRPLCEFVPPGQLDALSIAARHLADVARVFQSPTVTNELSHAAIMYVHEMILAYGFAGRETLSLAIALKLEDQAS